MDKDNSTGQKHPWYGLKLVFSTQHKKEKVLSPLFEEIGLKIISSQSNTDLLGTFSGEVERAGSVRETLRKKIEMAKSEFPDERFFLASEGSFGPHPFMAFAPSDLESLLLYDKNQNCEIYAEFMSTDVVHDEMQFKGNEDLQSFLNKIQFPSHGVIVRPDDSYHPIFKGLHEIEKVKNAVVECLKSSKNKKVIVATDLRAHHSPTRQKAILQAGRALLESLQSFCPNCSYPGFSITGRIPGLPCMECGEASSVTKDVLYSCPSCKFEKVAPRPDGIRTLPADECELCNP